MRRNRRPRSDAAPFAVRSQQATRSSAAAVPLTDRALPDRWRRLQRVRPRDHSQFRMARGISFPVLLAFAGLAGPPQVAGFVWRRQSWLKGTSKERRLPVNSRARAARKRSLTNERAKVESNRLLVACKDARQACRSDRSVSGE